jgi:hypothetical protein
MRLEGGGIDVFYVDESMDANAFAISAIAIPFLRLVGGSWALVWEDEFQNIRDWRRRASKALEIPVAKELKGQKLLSGRGRYKRGLHQFTRKEGALVYGAILADTAFLPDHSIITVVGHSGSNLMGFTKLEALVVALLQRMRTACAKASRNGMVFFDQGHGEYRKLYRRARVYLPTGSRHGRWGRGQATKNLPLDNFTKDANIKESEHSFFVQLADLLSHAAFLKIKGEQGRLSPWQAAIGADVLYDLVPLRVINTDAATSDPQGIVRL